MINLKQRFFSVVQKIDIFTTKNILQSIQLYKQNEFDQNQKIWTFQQICKLLQKNDSIQDKESFNELLTFYINHDIKKDQIINYFQNLTLLKKQSIFKDHLTIINLLDKHFNKLNVKSLDFEQLITIYYQFVQLEYGRKEISEQILQQLKDKVLITPRQAMSLLEILCIKKKQGKLIVLDQQMILYICNYFGQNQKHLDINFKAQIISQLNSIEHQFYMPKYEYHTNYIIFLSQIKKNILQLDNQSFMKLILRYDYFQNNLNLIQKLKQVFIQACQIDSKGIKYKSEVVKIYNKFIYLKYHEPNIIHKNELQIILDYIIKHNLQLNQDLIQYQNYYEQNNINTKYNLDYIIQNRQYNLLFLSNTNQKTYQFYNQNISKIRCDTFFSYFQKLKFFQVGQYNISLIIDILINKNLSKRVFADIFGQLIYNHHFLIELDKNDNYYDFLICLQNKDIKDRDYQLNLLIFMIKAKQLPNFINIYFIKIYEKQLQNKCLQKIENKLKILFGFQIEQDIDQKFKDLQIITDFNIENDIFSNYIFISDIEPKLFIQYKDQIIKIAQQLNIKYLIINFIKINPDYINDSQQIYQQLIDMINNNMNYKIMNIKPKIIIQLLKMSFLIKDQKMTKLIIKHSNFQLYQYEYLLQFMQILKLNQYEIDIDLLDKLDNLTLLKLSYHNNKLYKEFDNLNSFNEQLLFTKLQIIYQQNIDNIQINQDLNYDQFINLELISLHTNLNMKFKQIQNHHLTYFQHKLEQFKIDYKIINHNLSIIEIKSKIIILLKQKEVNNQGLISLYKVKYQNIAFINIHQFKLEEESLQEDLILQTIEVI